MAGFLTALAGMGELAGDVGQGVNNWQTVSQQQTNRQQFYKSLDQLGPEGEIYRQMARSNASPEAIITTMQGDVGKDIKEQYIRSQIDQIIKDTPDPTERAWKVYALTNDPSVLRDVFEAERFGMLHPPVGSMKEEINNAIAVAKAHPNTIPPAALDMLNRAAASNDPATIKAGYDMVTKGVFGASMFGYRVVGVPMGLDALGNPILDYRYFPNRPTDGTGGAAAPAAAGAAGAGAPGAAGAAGAAGAGGAGAPGPLVPPTPPPASTTVPSLGEAGGAPGALTTPLEGGETPIPGAEAAPPGTPGVPSPVAAPSAAGAGLPPSVPTTAPPPGAAADTGVDTGTPGVSSLPGGTVSSGVRGTKISPTQAAAAQTVQALIGQVQSLQDRVAAIDTRKWDRSIFRRRYDYEKLVYGGTFPEDNDVADLMDQTITVNRVAAAALAATAHMRAQAFIAGGEGHLPQAFYDKKAILRNCKFLLAPDGPYMSALRELGMKPLPRAPGLNIGPAKPLPPGSPPLPAPAAEPSLSPDALDFLNKNRLKAAPPRINIEP